MTPRYLFAILFILAGVLHFVFTPKYVSIMPPYLPAPTLLVQISGICEILGGLGLLVPVTQQAAACGIIALLVCVMPANLNMALHPNQWPAIPAWLLWLRLPLQLPLIYWAWLYTRHPKL
jgi:uncharacterized membrane protein